MAGKFMYPIVSRHIQSVMPLARWGWPGGYTMMALCPLETRFQDMSCRF
jgi:hypothetical protein